MAISPEEFASQYLPIQFAACEPDDSGNVRDGGSQQVFIRKYINANFRYKKDETSGKIVELPYEANKGMPYTEMKNALLGFVLDRARKNKSGFHLFANNTICCFDTTPDISVAVSIFQHAFDGKCMPGEVRDVLRLFTYWHATDPEPRKRWQTPQAFADQCLGLDCNGYVGSYFRSQYSWLGIGPETPISGYETRRLSKVRKSLDQIEPLDVLIFPGYVHIALVGRVISRTQTGVLCRVCQSTGSGMNGLQSTDETITLASGKFMLGTSELKAIVKVNG